MRARGRCDICKEGPEGSGPGLLWARVGTELFRQRGFIYSDLLDTHLLSRLPRALPIAPWIAASSLVRAVDAFSQGITLLARYCDKAFAWFSNASPCAMSD